ncbi:MAG: DUF4281 domain-containing protein, partial [Moorea sp. SIO2I5]|nr:DUF4281 domain-containing protein [Moorena sp. SIO2I5]
QGQQAGIWTIHSLVLCLFAGPIGLLSHIITAWVTHKFTSDTPLDSETTSPSQT